MLLDALNERGIFFTARVQKVPPIREAANVVAAEDRARLSERRESEDFVSRDLD